MFPRFLCRGFIRGAAKKAFSFRTVRPQLERISTNELLWSAIQDKNIQTTQDWKNVRNEILNTHKVFTPANIDAITVNVCTNRKKYDLALSYLDFLKTENMELNLATIGKYFKLLYVRGVDESLSEEDENRILAMYDNLRKLHPVLDSLTLENVIQALSLTKKWTLCTELLDEIKVSSLPTSNSYSAVIAAAFTHGSDDLAWKLLDEMLANNKTVQDKVYTSYFNKVAKDKSTKLAGIDKMFNFLQKNSLKIDAAVVNDFVDSLINLNLTISSSNVGARGICRSCNTKLQTFELTDPEFNDLKTSVVKNVIIGKDVFNRSSPEELTRFREFIAKMEKFDVIIDGLNVAYSVGVTQSPQITSGLLAAVITHFVRTGKKVLVLGRSHMNRWPKQNWEYIKQNATTFLTQDLSQDDPYLLYCALHSGKDTIVVTRDLMRGHKFLLNEVRLKLLFERWLAQRQYFLVKVQARGGPIFKKPLPFSHIAQKSNGFWHIPCAAATSAPSSSTNWLCVKI